MNTDTGTGTKLARAKVLALIAAGSLTISACAGPHPAKVSPVARRSAKAHSYVTLLAGEPVPPGAHLADAGGRAAASWEVEGSKAPRRHSPERAKSAWRYATIALGRPVPAGSKALNGSRAAVTWAVPQRSPKFSP